MAQPRRTRRRRESLMASGIAVERISGGQPLVAPRGDGWESRVTCNPGAVYLSNTPENATVIEGLLGRDGARDPRAADGIVAVIYSGGACGLAVFTPRCELLKRFAEPVFGPTGDPKDLDCVGLGDPRISRIGDTFYMLYSSWNGSAAYCCMAYSRDLIHWERQGLMPGNINAYQNKDHVLFEQQVDDWHYCLHRPWNLPFEQKDYAIRLARSRSPMVGPWQDCGTILRAFQHPGGAITWLGAGTVPIPLGGSRFLMLYHNGAIFEGGWRRYDGCAAILDFERFSLDRPEDLVTARLESFLVPETPFEKNPRPELRIDIVFPTGSYVFGEELYIIYGAGDTYCCAARVNKNALVEAVERAGLENSARNELPDFY
ncbi:MAG: hypothetical protein E4H48_05250 [Syntrophobacterales bacterium]|nr:MAG: hypothetical protein E4H48_05250 [Syntrophobacterales bacterium]